MKIVLKPITNILPRERVPLIRELRIAFDFDLRRAKLIVDTLMGVGERSGEPEEVVIDRKQSKNLSENQVISNLKNVGFNVEYGHLPEHLFIIE